jgi:hypothetical protein
MFPSARALARPRVVDAVAMLVRPTKRFTHRVGPLAIACLQFANSPLRVQLTPA